MTELAQQLVSDLTISEEPAAKAFESLCEFYDIDFEDIEDESVRTSLESAKKKIVRAIRKGRIEIKDEDGVPIIYQHIARPIKNIDSPIRYRELDGRSKIAMKDTKSTDLHGKLYSFMGGLSGLGQAKIALLKGVDISLVECFGLFFLQV
jgi:hypothetical protein